METEDPRLILEQLVREHRKLRSEFAHIASPTRLLAENEPIGDLVIYSLSDDELAYSHLFVYFKFISDWLRETEDRYGGQFPGDIPKTERLALSEKPADFKSR